MKRRFRRASQEALRSVFGLTDFRPGQKAATNCLLSGRDLLCILPTGAGKSLCWQLPAVVHPGLTVVISPLIALMEDQVSSLARRGVPAVAINSLMTPEERREAERQIRSGEARILFVAPERLELESFAQLIRFCRPWLFVVDEAHCVVQWGGEFRPVYSRIGEFVRMLPDRPVLCALTATADEKMQTQILRSLGMRHAKRVMLPVLRENLTYSVRTATYSVDAVLKLMAENPCRTVVFCRWRARAEGIAEALRSAGYAADYYHGKLSREQRTAVQERFRRGETQILAATSAFGMGVDIPDIRRVIHDALPGSITDLVQQSGRAGRDGMPAECVILITPGDLMWNNNVFATITGWYWIRHVTRLWIDRLQDWRSFRRVLKLAMTEPCIPQGISAAFGQRTKPCGRCSACVKGPLAENAPPLRSLTPFGATRWLLRWQRQAMAAARGVRPEKLVTRGQLRRMAADGKVPESVRDAEVRASMERLLRAIRQFERRNPQRRRSEEEG